MAIVHAPRTHAAAADPSRTRDTGIDLLRAVCVTGVVLLHAIMVGVAVTSDGPVFSNAADGAWWIVPVSWLLQVMPLFFIIGGFAGATAYRRQRERGTGAAAFVSARVHRLLRPAAIAIGTAGALLTVLAVLGVAPDLVAVAGFRYAQPLWFLGVFLLCQALLPALLAAHERMPVTALAALAGTAGLVDVIRAGSGIDGIGFLNLVFVWLTLQQLGFFFADGTVDALTRRTRKTVVCAAVVVLIFAFVTGWYSPDLVANINPPTGALLLVGIVHLGLLSLHRDRIARFSRAGVPAAFSAFVNRRTMTIYLWHMPVLLTMAGALALCALVTGAALPAPGSVEWAFSRPVWLVCAALGTALIAVLLSRFENASMPALATSRRAAAAATVIGASAVAMLLVAGTTAFTALLAVFALLVSMRVATQTSPRALSASPTSSA